ncbi:response regulator transcription factor [Alloiococcus sp. CFN-8]|uniref:response regulator transcription factor n=1 Tax=Alloiococcus sp. CFN-8 TaxID=3416081 RepID=UPI003CE74B7F
MLIIEDEDMIRKGIIFMVDWTRVNCTVVGEACDGNEGIERIKELKPDIVITDIKIPFKSGIEVIEETIDEYCYESIIVSGYNDFDYAKKAISLHVSEYILKPINFQQLYEILEKLTIKIEEKRNLKLYLNSLEGEGYKDKLLSTKDYNINYNKGRYVEEIVDYIKKGYKEKISLSDLCPRYNLSYTHLNSLFKEGTGYTFNDYLNRYRIIQSLELLKENKFKLYEIAEEVGFQDYKYFIHVFKKYIGCAPISFFKSNDHKEN